jgi:hypothetical protein
VYENITMKPAEIILRRGRRGRRGRDRRGEFDLGTLYVCTKISQGNPFIQIMYADTKCKKR